VVQEKSTYIPDVDKKQLVEERKKKLKEQAIAAKLIAEKPKDTERKAPAVCKISQNRGGFLMSESVPKVMAPKRAPNKLSFRDLEQRPVNGTSNAHVRQRVPSKNILKNKSENLDPNAIRISGPKKVVIINKIVEIW
jgi:hypothetical protein